MSVLLVTHSMSDAAEFCNRGIVLSQGRIVFEGLGKESVEYYFHHEHETPTGRPKKLSQDAAINTISQPGKKTGIVNNDLDPFHVHQTAVIDLSTANQVGNGAARALRALITGRDGKPCRVFHQGDWVRIYLDYLVNEPLEVPLVGIQIINAKGVIVHGRNSLQFEQTPPQISHNGVILRCIREIKLDIDAGEYTVETGFADLPNELFNRRHIYSPSEIAPQIHLICHVNSMAAISVIYRHKGSPCLFSHYGVADLPSHQEVTLLPLSNI